MPSSLVVAAAYFPVSLAVIRRAAVAE